jgi:hypothetical protein
MTCQNQANPIDVVNPHPGHWLGGAGGALLSGSSFNYNRFTCKVAGTYLELEPGDLVNQSSISYYSKTYQPQFCYPRALQLDTRVASSQKLTCRGPGPLDSYP